jgi:hypothetical protein
MLSRQDDHENASGLLIDFDYSERLGSRTENLAVEAEGVSNDWTNLTNDGVNLSNDVADAELDEDEDIGVRERIWTVRWSFLIPQVNQHS